MVVDVFPAVVDLLGLVCSPSLGSESLGLDRLFILSGLEGWRLRLPRSFGGTGRHGFCLRGHLMGVVSK